MFALYLITAEAEPSAIARSVNEALAAAPPNQIALQLRAKHLAARALLELAHELRALTRARGVRLLINDRADVARAVGADGVHLPEQGLTVAAARELLGNAACIGVSCHDAAGLVRAQAAAASFATLSPVFDSPGKGEALGPAAFETLARGVSLPVFALGGVQPEHARELRERGAAGLAVISGVFAAADRAAAVASYLARWSQR